ncbi:MAG: glycosyltransferase family 4 protein [Verrucomicrobiales bacterium]|nr:glycosyltransferase family 4 protein [Verrucomicrobiales bacterium]
MNRPQERTQVLHVVCGLASQGGVMAFAETAATSPVEGVDQLVWKHREYAGRDGVAWVRGGVARATDMGMRHDWMAGLREGAVLRRWLGPRLAAGERWVLHAHSRVGALAAAIAGRSTRCPTLIHLHKLSGQPWVYRFLVRWGRAGWVFNSQRTRRHHGVPEGGARVIYPPVRWPEAPAPDGGGGRWVAAGAFVRVKQFDRLLRAAEVLKPESGGATWPGAILGRSSPPVDPVHDAELAALAASVGGVELRPYSGAWVEFLRGDDVFVHPADLEAYGIVVLEAFARGCRMVVPPESVLDELGGDWRDAGGVVVASTTQPEGLAAAMRKARLEEGTADERWRRRRGVAGSVSVEECVCQLSGLYRSLSDTNRCFRNSSRP